MKKIRYALGTLIAFMFCAWTIPLLAQQPTCGTPDIHTLLEEDPAMGQRMMQFNAHLEAFKVLRANQRNKTSEELPKVKYIIPTVVHVIHDGNPSTPDSISMAQVISQFIAVNHDLRHVPGTAGFGPGIDTEIELSLATIDTAGNPTSGILYHNDSTFKVINRSPGRTEENFKQKYFWDRTRYLNIWLVGSITTRINNRDEVVLGYATFPYSRRDRDGLTLDYNFFGTIEEAAVDKVRDGGRTLTHEVGHWLGLYHPFQSSRQGMTDGCQPGACHTVGDSICGTPPTKAATFGRQANRQNSCTVDDPDRPDRPDNYMDYLDDPFLSHFTPDQMIRMQATLENRAFTQRYNLWQRENLQRTGTGPYGRVKAAFAANRTVSCANTTIQFMNYAVGAPEKRTWLFPGGSPATSSAEHPVVQYTQPGNYAVTLIIENEALVSQKVIDTLTINNFIRITGRPTIIPNVQSFNAFPPFGWTVVDPDAARSASSYGWRAGQGNALIEMGKYPIQFERDELYSPVYNIANKPNVAFIYNYAYAPMNLVQTTGNLLFSDTLVIEYSTDCGQNWETLSKKGGLELSTTGQAYDLARPNDFSDRYSQEFWKSDTLCVNELNSPTIQIRFTTINGFGNNLFLDEFTIDEVPRNFCTSDVSRSPLKPGNRSLVVQPNPTLDGSTTLQLDLSRPATYSYSIVDLTGRVIQQAKGGSLPSGVSALPIELHHYPAGIYLVQLYLDGASHAVKVWKP
jgi:PKD repeat protein